MRFALAALLLGACATAPALRPDPIMAEVEREWLADGDPARIAARFTGQTASDALVVRALGRLATLAELPLLVRALGDVRPEVRNAAGVALGGAARRKLRYPDATEARLVALLADPAAQYGAVYGLAAMVEPAIVDETISALTGLMAAAPAPEVRALAVKALAARQVNVVVALADDNVWVRVEAVRGLSGPKSSEVARAALADWLAESWARGPAGAALHPILEGLSRLEKATGEAAVGAAFARIRATHPDVAPMAADHVACLTAAGLVRHGGTLAWLADCGGQDPLGWPVWARRQLLVAALADGVGLETERRAALASLAADSDVRVRAVVPDAAAALSDTELLRKLLHDEALVVVESVLSALGGLGDKAAPAWARDELAALEARAVYEPELLQAIVEVRVQLNGAPASAPAAAPRPENPPVPRITGKPVLAVTTSKGRFRVVLDAELAPWNVSTVVGLARKRFYDGTVWHRVVPGFVVQGGDPTGTGAGGPGFNVAGEPSARSFVRGTVGIADSGRNTGSSQWFVMHASAPHLDGRYTVVGHVPEEDMAIVDQLQLGDTILRVEVSP